jgi:DNA-binding CsgD family transcriptional regulator
MDVEAREHGADARPAWSEGVEQLVDCIGSPRFGQDGIEHLNRMLLVQWWTVYEIFGEGPSLIASGRRQAAADCVPQAWAAYTSGVHAVDRSFDVAGQACADGRYAVAYTDAREFEPLHRARIYAPHALAGRLSVVARNPNGGLLALNLYRETGQAGFSDKELDQVACMGGLLLACVRRHAVLATPVRTPHEVPAFLQMLGRREREVCVRLLRGWTQEGIAADLAISATTVRTYRDRAFERLGILSRHQLFARAFAERT